MPVIEKPADTVARARAAVRVATAMPVPLRGTVTVGMSLPFCGGGWATAGGALGTVTTGLRFLRYRACRWAPVASLALGRSGVMLSVICVPYFQNVLKRVALSSL